MGASVQKRLGRKAYRVLAARLQHAPSRGAQQRTSQPGDGPTASGSVPRTRNRYAKGIRPRIDAHYAGSPHRLDRILHGQLSQRTDGLAAGIRFGQPPADAAGPGADVDALPPSVLGAALRAGRTRLQV